MTPDDLQHRFEYHAPDEAKKKTHELIRRVMLGAATAVAEQVPPGREQSLAITHLEDAMMWANAGVARS